MIYKPATIHIGRTIFPIPDNILLIPLASAPGAPISDVIALPRLLKKS